MATFVLVHGSWHGAWCWEKLTPYLERAGHTVLAPDLPGHGADTMSPAEVTMDAYVRRVCETLDEAGEPVILVGHSMAGTVISGVAEQRPEQIERLVYLCAFLVPDGQSLFGIAQSDSQSLILPNLVINEAEGYTTVDSPARRAAFYNDCRDEDAEWALARLCTDPIGPVMTPLQLSAERFGRVPRTYIICTQDQAIGPDHQRMMEAGLPCHSVIELDAGHSPFISQPEALAGQLLNLAAPAPVSA